MAVFFSVYLLVWVGFGAASSASCWCWTTARGRGRRAALAPALLVAAACATLALEGRAIEACATTMDAGSARFRSPRPPLPGVVWR